MNTLIQIYKTQQSTHEIFHDNDGDDHNNSVATNVGASTNDYDAAIRINNQVYRVATRS
jgi:hypothetical protein